MAFRHLLSGAAVSAALLLLPVIPTGNLPLGAATAEARAATASIDIFFNALGDEGDWVKLDPYGYVWVPTDVPANWAPYENGHWAYTQRYGWTFVSDEPFAWAVYHYGRWGYDPDLGWFWVPGTVWAPAWITWRRSQDTIGWAPLPPEGAGYAISPEVEYVEPPLHYWHFVPAPEFLAPELDTVIIKDDETPFEETEFVGPVFIQNNVVVNKRIDVNHIQQVTRRPVQVNNILIVNDPRRAEREARRGALVAVAGRLAPPAKRAAPPKIVAVQHVKAPTKGQKVEAIAAARPPLVPLAGQPSATAQGQARGTAATARAAPNAAKPAPAASQVATQPPAARPNAATQPQIATAQANATRLAGQKKLQDQPPAGANGPAAAPNPGQAGNAAEANKGLTAAQIAQQRRLQALQSQENQRLAAAQAAQQKHLQQAQAAKAQQGLAAAQAAQQRRLQAAQAAKAQQRMAVAQAAQQRRLAAVAVQRQPSPQTIARAAPVPRVKPGLCSAGQHAARAC
jgi:hypothetical protein